MTRPLPLHREQCHAHQREAKLRRRSVAPLNTAPVCALVMRARAPPHGRAEHLTTYLPRPQAPSAARQSSSEVTSASP